MSQHDFSHTIYNELDDCHLGFIDVVALGRYMRKCGTLVSEKLICALIRRIDMDQDARLCKEEFLKGITPQERFTKSSLRIKKELVQSKITKKPPAKKVRQRDEPPKRREEP